MPPHSIDAEQAVLGGLDAGARMRWTRWPIKLSEQDFYRKDHRLIWRAINELANKGMPCDAVTLGDWFETNGLAEMVGGASYLIELANSTPSAANIAAYAEIVREKSVLRQLIDAGTSITEDGYRPEGKSVHEVLESAEQRVFKIAESGARGKKDSVSMREAVKDRIPPAAPNAIENQRPAHRRHAPAFTDLDNAHLRPAAVGFDHRGRATVDGQDRVRAEYRRGRRHSAARRRWWCFRWRCRLRSWRSA